MTGFIIYKNEDMGIVLIEVLNSSLYDLRDAEKWLIDNGYAIEIIGEFSYSSSLKEVFADYPCFELREIRAWTVEFIKDGIRKRLAELKEQEDSQQ